MSQTNQGNKQSKAGMATNSGKGGQSNTVHSVEKVGSSNSNGIRFPVHDHPDLSKVRGPRG